MRAGKPQVDLVHRTAARKALVNVRMNESRGPEKHCENVEGISSSQIYNRRRPAVRREFPALFWVENDTDVTSRRTRWESDRGATGEPGYGGGVRPSLIPWRWFSSDES